eukprot:scaffold293334_cov27-Tisochrysis_lutea.AAC.3
MTSRQSAVQPGGGPSLSSTKMCAPVRAVRSRNVEPPAPISLPTMGFATRQPSTSLTHPPSGTPPPTAPIAPAGRAPGRPCGAGRAPGPPSASS